jgi:hypothetical protein
MEQLREYRRGLLERTAAAVEQVRLAARASRDPHVLLEPGGWSLHQVLAHLRDVSEQVYPPRLHRILAEDDPLFEDFDAGAWLAAHYDPDEPLESILETFARLNLDAVTWLAELPAEAWNRPGTHPAYGTYTLQWWAERSLAHIEEHLAQIGG